MNSATEYYGGVYSSADAGGNIDQYTQGRNHAQTDHTPMDTHMLGSAQTLDQIINHNNQELLRRRTAYMPQYGQNPYQDSHQRRASMMEFGSHIGGDLAEFQFDPSPLSAIVANHPTFPKVLDPRKVRSREDLSLDTQFSQMDANFGPMTSGNSYTPLMSTASMPADPSSAYLHHNIDQSTGLDGIPGDVTPMNMPRAGLNQAVFSESPVAQHFPTSYAISNPDQDDNYSSPHTPVQAPQNPTQVQTGSQRTNLEQKSDLRRTVVNTNSMNVPRLSDPNILHASARGHQPKQRRMSTSDITPPPTLDPADFSVDPMARPPGVPPFPKIPNMYSASGFDMLGVLVRFLFRVSVSLLTFNSYVWLQDQILRSTSVQLISLALLSFVT